MQAPVNRLLLPLLFVALTLVPLVCSLPAQALASEKAEGMPAGVEPSPLDNATQPPGDCTWIVGEWSWFTGDVKTFAADHTMSDPTGEWTGTWACVDPQSGTVVLDWNQGAFVDHLALDMAGSRLSGENQFGTPVWGERLTH